MQKSVPPAIALGLLSLGLLQAGRASTQTAIAKFEVGRQYFFDFGPPNDFYELFLVRSVGDKTAVQKITLTPVGMNRCIAPPTVESEDAILDKSIGELLGTTNPCTIPEKELRREQKRCKKCMVFSGANVMMQFQCGTQTRLIRANVLDRDMFDPRSHTPEHTSWTIHLLEQLDAPLKPGVIYRPMFPMLREPETSKAAALDPDGAQELASGKYDSLFPSGPDLPSKLYRQALDRPPSPRVDLVSGSPTAPQEFVPPKYPPLARLAHIEGPVSVKVQFDENGVVRNATIVDGYLQLRTAVVDAAWRWKFPTGEPDRETVVTVNFVLNCPPTAK